MEPPSAQVASLEQGEIVADLRWGTHPPIVVDAPGGGPVRLGAHGRLSLQLLDPAPLRAAGWPLELAALRRRLTGLIAAHLELLLGHQALPLAELMSQRPFLAQRLRQHLEPALAALGLALPLLTLEGLAPLEAPQPLLRPLHVLVGDQPMGPLTLAQVAQLRWSGGLAPDSLVWHPGLVDWQPAASLAELAPLFRPPPPPPPLPA
ncbi:MAG: SPFH domain-containing protein [Cyanobacteriota bacterium]|nr:SPFH domain-containing protein [Cyanobacteriota bacterium]